MSAALSAVRATTRLPASSGRRRRGRGVRATPYSTSARKRNADPSAVDFLPNFTPTTPQVEFIKDVVGKTWQLHHVSPLWHLSTTSTSLSAHTQHLTTLFSQAVKNQSSFVSLKVSLKIVKKIGLDGSDGLKISATKKVTNKAFLCRLGRVDRVQAGFTPLPLLLSRGPQALTSHLQQWLQSSFDCHSSPQALESEDLCLLLGQFATAEKSGRGLGGVELVYKTPPTITKEGLSTVSVSLPYSSVVSVWEQAGGTERERRTGFVEVLEHHVERLLGFKLQAMSLLRVSTPVLHVEVTGRVKFTAEDPIIQVLAILQSVNF